MVLQLLIDHQRQRDRQVSIVKESAMVLQRVDLAPEDFEVEGFNCEGISYGIAIPVVRCWCLTIPGFNCEGISYGIATRWRGGRGGLGECVSIVKESAMVLQPRRRDDRRAPGGGFNCEGISYGIATR